MTDNPIAQLANLLAMASSVGVSDVRPLLGHIASSARTEELLELVQAMDTGVGPADAWSNFGSTHTRWATLASVMARTALSGSQPTLALEGIANRLNREERSLLLRRIRRSGVALLLPLGVCALPAFMLLSVVPLVASYFAHVHIGNL